MWRVKALRQICENVHLFHALDRKGRLPDRWAMAHLREQSFALLGFIMAELPLLVDPAELRIIDLHAGKPGLQAIMALIMAGGSAAG
jgi:hypothetical protein